MTRSAKVLVALKRLAPDACDRWSSANLWMVPQAVSVHLAGPGKRDVTFEQQTSAVPLDAGLLCRSIHNDHGHQQWGRRRQS